MFLSKIIIFQAWTTDLWAKHNFAWFCIHLYNWLALIIENRIDMCIHLSMHSYSSHQNLYASQFCAFRVKGTSAIFDSILKIMASKI